MLRLSVQIATNDLTLVKSAAYRTEPVSHAIR